MVYILNVWPKSYLKWLSFLVWRKYEPAYKGTLVPRHRSTSCRTLRRQLPGLPSCNKWFNTLMINCAFLVARFVNLEVLCTYYVLEIQWAPTLLAAGDLRPVWYGSWLPVQEPHQTECSIGGSTRWVLWEPEPLCEVAPAEPQNVTPPVLAPTPPSHRALPNKALVSFGTGSNFSSLNTASTKALPNKIYHLCANGFFKGSNYIARTLRTR